MINRKSIRMQGDPCRLKRDMFAAMNKAVSQPPGFASIAFTLTTPCCLRSSAKRHFERIRIADLSWRHRIPRAYRLKMACLIHSDIAGI